MKPPTTYPDVERLVVDVLAEHLPTYEPDATVGIFLPADWRPQTSPPHVLVATDGAPLQAHPVVIWPTVRLVGWSGSPTVAKRVVHAAQGALVAHADFNVVPLTGVIPSRDPDHADARLAWLTVRCTVRSVPLIPA